MTKTQPTFARCYLIFVGTGLGVASLTAALGVAVLCSGPDAVAGVLVGCGASWAANCIGAVPTASVLSTRPQAAATAVMTSTAVRFIVILTMVVPLVLSGWFPRTVLVVSVAVSYMMILLVDSMIAVRMIRRYSECKWP